MSRSRPASNPISYHKQTGQFYVTRGGRRLYLGSDRREALERYYRLSLGLEPVQPEPKAPGITVKELANRFIAAQQANWRNPKVTLQSYKFWLGRFIKDHPGLRVSELTVEKFASWKMLLRERKYMPETINHFLNSVRTIYKFAEDAGIVESTPRLKRVKNETVPKVGSKSKPLYSSDQISSLLANAGVQLRAMILLALNCGFGPKDLHDLTWDDIDGDRVTLPRSKTGICQTYLLWPETKTQLEEIRCERAALAARSGKRRTYKADNGHIFVTRFWRPWNKDAMSEQFRKLCKRANVPCYGIYRLRHCASTTLSLVATPHVQRRFMRHSQLQQQVTYTHTPDIEVDKAILRARGKLLGEEPVISSRERNPGPEQAA